jgi:hypothetical protein
MCVADVLEWTWFLNSFSDKHIYDFMYGDKDTFGVGFGLAGKAHFYQHINVPPGESHVCFVGPAAWQLGWKSSNRSSC